MAQLRLIGEPDDVQRTLDAMRATLRVTDVTGPSPSRKTANHVIVYAHVETLLPAEQPRRRAASTSSRSTL